MDPNRKSRLKWSTSKDKLGGSFARGASLGKADRAELNP
jgi:hypothetical protein